LAKQFLYTGFAAVNYEMLKALKEVNEHGKHQVYTVPTPEQRWSVSQIEGMALFSLALHQSYEWYKANHLSQTR
jgi:hypothetical protein